MSQGIGRHRAVIGSTRSSCGQAVRGDLPEDRLATITLGNASTGRPRTPAAAADAHEIGWSSQLTARCVHWRQPEARTHSVTCAATAVRGCDPIVRAKKPMASWQEITRRLRGKAKRRIEACDGMGSVMRTFENMSGVVVL